jgi:Uma2 family endonuclease
MSTPPKQFLTPEQYLEIEEAAEGKSEYCHGEMRAMPAANYRHNLAVANLSWIIGNQLAGGPCAMCVSAMRVHTPRTGLYTYPDAVVVCGEPKFLDRKRTTLLNPTAVIEVLSPSTEAYDRGRKFEHYQSIDSLREYLLIDSQRISVTLYRRQSGAPWLLITENSLDGSVELESVGCRLTLRDLYEKVEFPAEAPAPAARAVEG